MLLGTTLRTGYFHSLHKFFQRHTVLRTDQTDLSTEILKTWLPKIPVLHGVLLMYCWHVSEGETVLGEAIGSWRCLVRAAAGEGRYCFTCLEAENVSPEFSWSTHPATHTDLTCCLCSRTFPGNQLTMELLEWFWVNFSARENSLVRLAPACCRACWHAVLQEHQLESWYL